MERKPTRLLRTASQDISIAEANMQGSHGGSRLTTAVVMSPRWAGASTPHHTQPTQCAKQFYFLSGVHRFVGPKAQACKPLYLGCWCGLVCNQARIALSHVITVLGPLYELCGAVGPISGNTATQRHTVSSTPHHSPQSLTSQVSDAIGHYWT